MKKVNRGFALLLAVLVSSILLALGLSIYNITSKQVILSSSGRESQFAFYAADAGVECALYWDFRSVDQSPFAPDSTTANINCGEGTIPPGGPGGGVVTPLTRIVTSGGDTHTTTFSFSLGPAPSDPCAFVSVEKTISTEKTIIESLGYNTCVTTNPRRLERAIRTRY